MLIRELNNNIAKVVDLYRELSVRRACSEARAALASYARSCPSLPDARHA